MPLRMKDGRIIRTKVVLIMREGANHGNGLIKIDEFPINDNLHDIMRKNERMERELRDLKLSLKELRKDYRTLEKENKILEDGKKWMMEKLVAFEASTY